MANSNSLSKYMRHHQFHGDMEPVSRNRVKFLCSHGGKFLPRPADGHLTYTAGETRVISVHRQITFSELMKKLTSKFNVEMILKYQLDPQDLDVLVTVRSDEDVHHMIDECDQHEHIGAARLRCFLFPAIPTVMQSHLGTVDHHHSTEQRYINSVNGIVVNPSSTTDTSYNAFSVPSAYSTPRTPPETAYATSSINPELTTRHGKHGSLTRNHHSSPSLCNLGSNFVMNHHQPPPQPQPQSHHHKAHMTPKPPLDRHSHKTSCVAEYYRQQMDHRTDKGGQVYYQRGSSYDAYYENCGYDRTDSPPRYQ